MNSVFLCFVLSVGGKSYSAFVLIQVCLLCSRGLLKKQMISIRLEPDETMTSYLGRLRACSDSLKEAEYEIKDDDLAYAILSDLPDSYEDIIMTLVSMDDYKFKSLEIRGILLPEYERKTAKETDKVVTSYIGRTVIFPPSLAGRGYRARPPEGRRAERRSRWGS